MYIKIESELKEKLKKIAVYNDRSLSSQIIFILKEYIKNKNDIDNKKYI